MLPNFKSITSVATQQKRMKRLILHIEEFAAVLASTFHHAPLKRYTLMSSGVPQKLSWFQQFGLQLLPKSTI